MNKWQTKYCEEYFNGKMPRTARGKEDVQLLGMVKSSVTVHLPNGTQTYVVTEDDCDMPNGKISVRVLANNLSFWLQNGYRITTA